MNIQSKVETIKAVRVVLDLSEMEATAFLLSPRKVQHEVKKVLARFNGKVKIVRRVVKRGRKAKSKAKAKDGFPQACEYCGKEVKWLAIHLKTCKSNPDQIARH